MFSIAGQTLKLNSAEDVKSITSQLEAMEDLEEIKLSGNTLGVEAAQSIAAALSNKKLKVRIVNSQLENRIRRYVYWKTKDRNSTGIGCIRSCTDPHDNAFGPAGAKPLMKLLIENRSIQILKLNNNGLGIEGVRLISSALVEAGDLNTTENRVSSLRILQMGRNRMESSGANHLIKAFDAHSNSLEEIRLYQNSIRPDVFPDLMPILANCKNLKILDLQDNTLTESGSIALSNALPSWEFLKTLNVGECLLRSKGAAAIIKSLTQSHVHLEQLYLSFNEIDTEAASLIPLMLENKSKLELLELNGNEFDPQGSIVTEINQILRKHGHVDALDELDEMEWGDSDEEDEEDDDEEGEAGEELELTNQLEKIDSVTAKMELTASRMLNSAGNDFVQSSRMSSFPSSESISSVMSWHGPTESMLKSKLEIATDAVDQNPKLESCTVNSVSQKVTVEMLPERFGFLKKHVKYLITGPNFQVRRRYSDFLWIHEYLFKKYPFRIIIKIPPKKLALDRVQLDHRRRGLQRFINYIFSHPVFSIDSIVNDFLNEKSEFQDLAQKIQYVDEESCNLEVFDFPNDLDIYLAQLVSSINILDLNYTDLLRYMELLKETISSQYGTIKPISNLLKQIAVPLDCLDATCITCKKRCDGFSHVARGLDSVSRMHNERYAQLLEDVIDFLNLQIDIFGAIKDMILRREKIISDINLPMLNKRIETGTIRLDELSRLQGAADDIQKRNLSLDQDRREKEWLEKKISFMNYFVWSEIQWNHGNKSNIDDHIMHFVSYTRDISLNISKILNGIKYLDPPDDETNDEFSIVT